MEEGQIEICAGRLRCLRNLVSAQAASKFAQVCVSACYGYKRIPIYILLKWIYLVDLNTDTSLETIIIYVYAMFEYLRHLRHERTWTTRWRMAIHRLGLSGLGGAAGRGETRKKEGGLPSLDVPLLLPNSC